VVGASTEPNLVPYARVEVPDPDFLRLFSATVSNVPRDVLPIRTLVKVRLRRKGRLRGLAGLTWYGTRQRPNTKARQHITFYTHLLDQLSKEAKVAVIAHELAHAWLNEHLRPEQSRTREKEADDLARRWGFGEELAALENETETI
jgi:Zn-dependent protease with chaperone function